MSEHGESLPAFQPSGFAEYWAGGKLSVNIGSRRISLGSIDCPDESLPSTETTQAIPDPAIVTFADDRIRLTPNIGLVYIDNEPIDLTPKAVWLISFLGERAGRTVARKAILEAMPPAPQ